MTYCYFGHHKCASTWITAIIYDICAISGLRPYQKQSNLVDDIQQLILSEDIDFYICQTSLYEKISKIRDYKGFHIIRDPRDLIISGYYSHLYSHSTDGWPELYQHREELKKLNKNDGILKEIEFSSYFIDHINNWNYNDPNILELKMEDLTKSPKVELTKILKFLELYQETNLGLTSFKIIEVINRLLRKNKVKRKIKIKLNSRIVNSITEKRSFKKLSKGRNLSDENIYSHYRKGVSGDWKNHFNSSHLELFNEMYPGLIEKLNYSQV